MSSTLEYAAATLCSQCGTRGHGRFCANCASPLRLDDESVSAELRSKFTKPLIGLLSFIKTTWLVARSPRVFFKSYVTASPPLSALPFPLAGAWRRISSKPQNVMRPFQGLATALGLAATVAGLQDWAWRVTGFSERVFGMSKAQMAENSERGLRAFYEQQFGRALTIIDTSHLTGFGLFDAPAHEVIKFLQYMYFPLVVSIFLIGRAIKRPLLVHTYVYAVGASVAILFLSNVAGLVVFMLLQSVSPQAALGLSGLPVLVGYVAGAYMVVVLPIIVLPEILPVSRARVGLATIVGAVVWMTANAFMSRVMLFNLGVVLT